ncbi:MAG: helix-turn-helix transcriptional regulator [Phycisphaerae bacterium]|nr:helix-turn-helix transcriptional regulator [Phycisphaerae bacterium]
MERTPELKIGSRVREFRAKASLSLDALAQASGVSKAMLSQIEQNKANPTVAVMYKIANGLRLDLGELMGLDRPRRTFEVIRAEDPNQVFISNRQVTVRTLSPLAREKDVEFYEIRLAPGGEIDSAPHFQNTEEYLTVAQGRVLLASDKEEVMLKKGDSAHYSADVHHRLAAMGKSTARLYLVVKYRGEGL